MDYIILKHDRHAVHDGKAGSWFRPKEFGLRGHRIFYTDADIVKNIESFGSRPAADCCVKDGLYKFPLTEIHRANLARLDYLNRKCATAARKEDRQARDEHRNLYRFIGSLIEGVDGMMARFQCGDATFDCGIGDLKVLLTGYAEKNSLLLEKTDFVAQSFLEKDIIKAISHLSGNQTYRTQKGDRLSLVFGCCAEDIEGRKTFEFYPINKGHDPVILNEEQLCDLFEKGVGYVLPGVELDQDQILNAVWAAKPSNMFDNIPKSP